MIVRRKWIVFIVWVFLCKVNLWAQFSEDHRFVNVDSLENVLRTNPPQGADLLKIYWDLSWNYLYEDDHEKMMYYSRKGIELAERKDSLYIVADLYNNLGVAYDYVSKADSALLYFEKALEAVKRMEKGNIGNPARIARMKAFIYGSTANVYSSIQGKTNEALEYYFKALKLFEEYQINNEIANVLGNIGITYFNIENYEKAEIYLLEKEAICRQNNYEVNLAHALIGLGVIYHTQKNFSKALSMTEEALAIYEKYDTYPASLLDCYSSLSSIYLEGYGNDVKAMEYVELALKKAEEMEIPLDICHTLMLQSEIFLFRKDYAAAEKSALKALLTDSTHFSVNRGLYECLAKANIGMGNVDKANEYFDRFKNSQTIYANTNFQEQLSEMEVKYETEKKEMRISLLEEEKRLALIASGLIFLLGLIALFFVWRWIVQKHRKTELQIHQLEQEKQLIATQAALDGEAKERTRLARDLHDSLGSILAATKYNLTHLKKTVGTNASEAEHFDTTIGLLDDSMSEMRRIAHNLMPESLYKDGLKQSLTNFCNSIPHMNFAYYGDESRLDPQLEVMIYHIVHELANNALKHAKASYIFVQIVRDADQIFLTVQDDGCGFDTGRQTEGMGLDNIRNRVISFNGEVDIHSVVGEGTEVNVKLQISN